MVFSTVLFVPASLHSADDAAAWCPGYPNVGVASNSWVWVSPYWRGGEVPWYNTCSQNGSYHTKAYDYNATDPGCTTVEIRSNFTDWTYAGSKCSGGYSSWISEFETDWPGSASFWSVRVCYQGTCNDSTGYYNIQHA